MNGEPKTRILRQVSGEQDKVLRVFETLRYATIENIKVKDGQIRRMEIKIIFDLDDPEAFRKVVDELRTIPL